jgi:hypothetical protein
VDGSERLERALGEGLDLAQIGDIRTNGQRLGALGLHLLAHDVHGRLVEVGDHDPRPLVGQRQHQRPPDPAPPAGYDRDLALERFHGSSR